jgi:hypothetical protein
LLEDLERELEALEVDFLAVVFLAAVAFLAAGFLAGTVSPLFRYYLNVMDREAICQLVVVEIFRNTSVWGIKKPF